MRIVVDDIDPLHWEGIQLYTQGRYMEAENTLRKSLENDPSNASIICDIGETLEGQRRLLDAEKAYRTAIEFHNTYQQAWYKLGAVLIQQEKFNEAIIVFKRAIELLPDYVFSWEGYGYALWKDGQISEAIVALKQSIELEIRKSDSMSWFHLGSLYYEQGDYEEAEQSLSNIDRFRWPEFWNLLGKIYSKLGKADLAENAFEKAREDQPEESSK
jgi:tetratricopeptide (TPR) repeat protein